MRPKREEYVLYRGEKFQVEFFFTQRGELPAKEYFDDSSDIVKVKLLALVKYLAEQGRIFDRTKFRMVDKDEKIFEFKPLSERFFSFFFEGAKVIITNAYRKRTQKVDRKELAKAIRLKKDYGSRVRGGTYYEE